MSELLRTAVRCLKERPVLFKYCAEEVSLLASLKSVSVKLLRYGYMPIWGMFVELFNPYELCQTMGMLVELLMNYVKSYR